jgi:hypothetical protein
MSNTAPKNYAMSLRLNAEEADRIKKITDFTGQSMSDFIRVGVRAKMEVEELRIMTHEAERLELQQRIAKSSSRKKTP